EAMAEAIDALSADAMDATPALLGAIKAMFRRATSAGKG
ncbi:MAG: hypothetical protein ACI9AX_001905, partial [Polaromonas sp.]